MAVAINGRDAGQIYDDYRTGVAGQMGLTLVCALYGPNIAVWAASYLVGPGFAIGAGIGSAYGYYDSPYYYDDSYGYYDDTVVAASPPVGDDSVAYCMQRYKSYDPASGTYLGYDGLRHPCPAQ
jgi:hypothetical protein